MAEALTSPEPGEPVAEPELAGDGTGELDTVAVSGAGTVEADRMFRRREEDHGPKFRVALLALAVVLGAAVAGFVALVLKPTPESAAAGWSDWRPGGGADVERAQAIADFVGVNYRLAGGQQLVTIQAEEPVVQSFPVDFIAIQSATGTVYSGAQLPLVFRDADSKGIQYLLCGLGTSCSISVGEPSAARQRLLRREALELALYTFRYVDGRDYVVVFMPPRPGDTPRYALFFDRSEFSQEIDVPLRQTLPDPLPPQPGGISPVETSVIDELTNPRLFAFSYTQLQNQQVVLVLDDPATAAQQQQQQQQQQSTQSDQGSTGSTDTTTTATTATQ